MSRDDKIQAMVENYAKKRDQSVESPVMEFHRKHLVLFLNRFCQLLSRFGTPSSSLLSHEVFLVVEAATIVARSDWEKSGESDLNHYEAFAEYFSAFDELTTGLVPLADEYPLPFYKVGA